MTPSVVLRRQPARRVRLRQCQTDSIEGRGLPLRQLASRATGKPTDRQTAGTPLAGRAERAARGGP